MSKKSEMRREAKAAKKQLKAERQKKSKITTSPPPVEYVTLSYMYYEAGRQFCLSCCTQDEVKHFKDCARIVCSMTWNDLYKTASKGAGKTGLAFTRYEDSDLKGVSRPAKIPSDCRISAVRASDKLRLFGVRLNTVFYVLWFDREHKIVPC